MTSTRAEDRGSRTPTTVPDAPRDGALRIGGWSWLPVLSLIGASGLLAVAASFSLVGAGQAVGEPLFWIGLLLICAPITLRQAAARVGVLERVGLLVVLGLLLQLVHVVRSPAGFTNYDELLHLRTLTDIVASGHLFATNPLLVVSPLFPGLETITAAVVQLSGADPFAAAEVVLAFARILFAVGLFALYREASGSERVAGLAAAIYMLNPNFTFFDSAYSYESLALPLVPILLLLAAIRSHRNGRAGMGLALGGAAATLAITHHVTVVLAAAIVLTWLAIAVVQGRRDRYDRYGIAFTAGVVLGAASLWLLVIGPIVVTYLSAPISAAITEALRLVSTGQGRVPFQSATGQVASLWERFVGLGTAALLTFAIPIGLAPLLRHHRASSLALLLGLISLAYPVSLVARLTPTGSEAAGRSLGFVFLGLSFVVALGIVATADTVAGQVRGIRDPRRWTIRGSPAGSQQAWKAAFAGSVAVVILGGAVLGAAPATRFPGPYIVGADARSIDNESTAAALWTRELLGPHRRIAGDRVNRLLMGSYGLADVVFEGSTGIQTWQVFLSSGVALDQIARITDAQIEYLVIDRRLSTSLPLVPFYYEEGEIFEGRHSTPVSADVLGKWDTVPEVDRVYDSGDIQLYDVRRLAGGP